MRTCSICDRAYFAKGYCQRHYMRWRKHGDPNFIGKYTTDISPQERLDLYKQVDPITGCWNWTGCLGRWGYGQFQAGGLRGPVHRIQYEMIHGEAPDHLVICHRCDNRRCFNPEHLFLGTRAENMWDMVAKSRQARGEKNGHAKLTAEQVLAIRADARPQAETAADYGITQSNVARIKAGNRWRHIEGGEASETSHWTPPPP